MEQTNSLVVCYKCHQFKEPSDFKATADDPLAQVCDDCKKEGESCGTE